MRSDGQQLRIWAAHPAKTVTRAPPGTILSADGDGITVMCGREALVIERLQRPGRRVVSAREFLQSQPLTGRSLG